MITEIDMVVVVLLGENDEYLGYKSFDMKYKAELFVGNIHQLMLANIEKKLSLKERLEFAPEYFPYAGRVQDVELIELNSQGEKHE